MWNARLRLVASFQANSDADLHSVASNQQDTILVMGDTNGVISVWDTTQRNINPVPVLSTSWTAHQGCITAVRCASYNDIALILSASVDGTARMWLPDGTLIGIFGQAQLWVLGRPHTYAAATMASDSTMEVTQPFFFLCKACSLFRRPGA
jgi:WD40 repeat protein